MKCKYCGKEIDDDSVFCEQCGAKVEKKSSWKWWVIGGVVAIGLVMGVLAIIDYNRWTEVEDAVGSWPPCKEGRNGVNYSQNGVYYIIQKGYEQSLIRVERGFPIRIKFVDVVLNGKIFDCKGDHGGLGAFALLGNDGRVTFVTDYGSGGDLLYNGFSRIGGAMSWCSDINHIYGVDGDKVCGNDRENVETIFPDGCGQPVKVGDKWRYILIGGQYMFEDQFEDAYPFCYGKARVCKNGRWYYIDSNNHELVIHNNYDKRVTYEVLQGEDFHYDDNVQKVVAKMLLRRYGVNGGKKEVGDYWALVDETGEIVESVKKKNSLR